MIPQTLRQRAEKLANTICDHNNEFGWFDEIVGWIEKALLQVEKEALARGREETIKEVANEMHDWNFMGQIIKEKILSLLIPTKEGTNKGGRA